MTVNSSVLILYAGIHLISALLAGALGYWVLARTEMRSKRWFGVLVLGLALWSLAAVAELLLTGESGRVAAKTVSLAVGTGIPFVWVVFTADYTHRSIRANPVVRALGVAYAVLLAAVLTNPVYGFYAPLTFHETPFAHTEVGLGPMRVVAIAYVAASLIVGTYYLSRLFERGRSQVSTPTAIIAGSVLLGSVPFLSTVLGFAPVPTYDHTPFGISIFLLGVSYVVFRYRFYDLSPVARDVVLDETEDAMFVLDGESHLVDYNTAATRVVSGLSAADLGRPFRQIHAELAELVSELGQHQQRELALRIDGDRRHFSVRVSEIEKNTETIGTVVFLRDITERRNREQQLKRQNERLDQFASMVSHDLRNPLNVAQGRVEMIADDDENVEAVQHALDRMETMIEDMLTLARAGQDIDDTEQHQLAELASVAWENVRTLDSELAVHIDDATVAADSTRLIQAFENLFRNAIDHNESALTISVGRLDARDGFYVEDDGAGIPADGRETVFDHGYTTSDDGSGLGLAIVRDVIEAHGWTITLTESEAGGARFEILTE